MTKAEIDAMQDQVQACQQAMLDAMIGWPVPVIMAALTTVAGALIAQQCRSRKDVSFAVQKVAGGMTMVASDAMGASHVQ